MAATAAWRPSALTPAQREERRVAAARLFARGRRDLAEIARQFGVCRQSVSRWFATWVDAGRAGLKARPKTGRRPEIDAGGWARLKPLLAAGALAAGFDTERWTLRRVAAVAERELGVRHHFRSYSRILRAYGWTPQRPAVQAKERDDARKAGFLFYRRRRISRSFARLRSSPPTTAACDGDRPHRSSRPVLSQRSALEA